jgi:cytochrome c oxidase cbb3-type subunit 3
MNWLDDYVNALSLLGAAVILILTVFVAGKYIKQMKDDKAEGDLAGENWDGIREFKNNPPIGWSLAFLGTMIWGVWYWFFGYPVNAFSQLGQWNEEVQEANSKFESKWADADKDTLKEMGQSIFLVQCAPCHGETAEGINGKAQNLVQWGHEEGIMNTIANGGKGSNYPLGEMPAGLLDSDSAKAVAAYVMAEISEKKATKYPELVETGKVLFATCGACHGEDGKGMGGMAPDLSTYGTTKFVSGVLEKGKKGYIGTMPSFKGRLTNIQQEAVGTYILSLGDE